MKIKTSVRVDDVFYNEAKEVFSRFGLSFGDAVNFFWQKFLWKRGFLLSLVCRQMN